MKETTATMITDHVFIGDEETAYDLSFMKQNRITRIVNTNGLAIHNIYDPMKHKDPLVKKKINETQPKTKMEMVIAYMTINNWSEHKLKDIEDYNKVI